MNKKIRIKAFIAFIIGALIWTSTASAQDLYFANGNTPTKLYKVDLSTNEATYLMDFGDYRAAVAVTIDGKNLVAIHSRGTAVSHVDLTVDPPIETKIGDLPYSFNHTIFQASYDINDTLYFTREGRNELYTLDLSTFPLAPTLIGNIGVSLQGADIAFDHDNTLYLLTNVGRLLYRVDTSNATATLIGSTGAPENIKGMAFTPDGRLVISCGDHHLYEVSTANAAITDLGTLTIGSTPLLIAGGDMARVSWSITVDINIKPGSDPNSINLSSAGVIPVAILSSDTFDATKVDPDTVGLAGARVKMVGKSGKYLCHIEDVNGDELMDLVCQVYTAQFMIEPGETIAVLEAETYDGRSIRGEDSIRIVKDN